VNIIFIYDMIKLNLTEELSRIKSIMYINEQVKHIYQPTGNSCGPTCIKMVGDFLAGDVGRIDDICKECGTDWVVGTPPDRMKLGLNKLGLRYIEHQHEIEPFQSIKNSIDKGNVAIVRTITENIPHWIVIDGYDEMSFNVNDPWLGPRRYDEQQLDSIWRIRDFFYFEIVGGAPKQVEGQVEIRKIIKEDEESIIPKLSEIFSKTGLSNDEVWNLVEYDPELTVVATVNSKVAGFYFLSGHQIPPGGNEWEKLQYLKGIEGVALGVLPEYKNFGIGKQLINYSQNIPGIDYIWGYQFKSLKNIDDWLRRRKIYWEGKGLYITYQIF
jgi:GNAT superfamily N-acetyltransferase